MILLDCCAHFNKTKLNQKMTARHTKSIGLVRIQMTYLTVCKDLHRRIRNASKKYGLCNRDTWSEDGGDGNSHAHTNEHLTTVLQAAKKYCLPVTKLIAILLVQIHFSFGSMSLCSMIFRMRFGFEWRSFWRRRASEQEWVSTIKIWDNNLHFIGFCKNLLLHISFMLSATPRSRQCLCACCLSGLYLINTSDFQRK